MRRQSDLENCLFFSIFWSSTIYLFGFVHGRIPEVGSNIRLLTVEMEIYRIVGEATWIIFITGESMYPITRVNVWCGQIRVAADDWGTLSNTKEAKSKKQKANIDISKPSIGFFVYRWKSTQLWIRGSYTVELPGLELTRGSWLPCGQQPINTKRKKEGLTHRSGSWSH